MISARRRRGARRTATAAWRLAIAVVAWACAATTIPAVAAPRSKAPIRYQFAGVPWLVPADSALARLEQRGYHEIREARERDAFRSRGRLFDHVAIASGHLDDRGRLVRWVIVIESPEPRYRYRGMRKVFDAVVAESWAKYSAPRNAVDAFVFPYQRGDGREDEALNEGKATVRREWMVRRGDRLTIEMDRSSGVRLTYETPEWAAVQARRKARKGTDL